MESSSLLLGFVSAGDDVVAVASFLEEAVTVGLILPLVLMNAMLISLLAMSGNTSLFPLDLLTTYFIIRV